MYKIFVVLRAFVNITGKNEFSKRLVRHWKLRKTLDRVEQLKELGMRLRWMLLRRFCLDRATLQRCHKNMKDDTVFRHLNVLSGAKSHGKNDLEINGL